MTALKPPRPVATPFGARSSTQEVLEGIDLTGQRYIVTGGSSGLGEATTRALARAGATVVIATRRPREAAALVDEFESVTARELDLSDLHSVHAFLSEWEGPVNGVVANAGIMAVPERSVTKEGWELHLATNYLGHFALVNGLHESLRAAGGSRVVIVSSGAQLMAGIDFDDLHFSSREYDPWVAYAQSKTADVLLAVAISRQWAGEGITATAMAPGFIHTNLQRHMSDETMKAFGAMADDGTLVTPDYYKTPDEAASTIALLVASPLVEGVTGAYFEDGQESTVVEGGNGATTGVASWAVNETSADRLWSLSLDAIGRVR